MRLARIESFPYPTHFVEEPEIRRDVDAERAERLGIPPLYRRAQIADFGVEDYAGKIPSEPRDLCIVGLNGRGKTHLAAALALQWRARWVGAAQLVAEVRSTYGRSGGGETESQVLERYCGCRALVLDDFLASSRTEHTLAILLEVVRERINRRHVTVVTLCQGLTEVRRIEPSIADRLEGFRCVRLLGESRRKS